jgi:hypothetical protein
MKVPPARLRSSPGLSLRREARPNRKKLRGQRNRKPTKIRNPDPRGSRRDPRKWTQRPSRGPSEPRPEMKWSRKGIRNPETGSNPEPWPMFPTLVSMRSEARKLETQKSLCFLESMLWFRINFGKNLTRLHIAERIDNLYIQTLRFRKNKTNFIGFSISIFGTKILPNVVIMSFHSPC